VVSRLLLSAFALVAASALGCAACPDPIVQTSTRAVAAELPAGAGEGALAPASTAVASPDGAPEAVPPVEPTVGSDHDAVARSVEGVVRRIDRSLQGVRPSSIQTEGIDATSGTITLLWTLEGEPVKQRVVTVSTLSRAVRFDDEYREEGAVVRTVSAVAPKSEEARLRRGDAPSVSLTIQTKTYSEGVPILQTQDPAFFP
jgi:hypothetical protein